MLPKLISSTVIGTRELGKKNEFYLDSMNMLIKNQ